ncbi:hypothetical protein AUG19_01055 [archaeon 13_1_20CM_2_54_9]|nr:MAG: hypothetical protein AUG19_01055 [archaeon 13_1_20CM_2_54_9]
MFRKILIANRSEIALRIIRTCKKLGVKTVAVYSEPDIESRHVLEADEAYNIGRGEPESSYLNIANIIKAARKSGSEGVHPGYGFLAENPDFATACEESSIVFIGPSSRVLGQVANKLDSKRIVARAGIPVIPGSTQPVQSLETAELDAKKTGFPILVKAVFGGGGRGLRIVRDPKQLRNALELAAAEAKTSFGREALYLEKYLEQPRHIEVQVLVGPRGRRVHLGERECSLQRRLQKILEETPSPILTHAARKRIISLALKVARVTHYENAGTMEFVRSKDGKFYYMETNKRIQVEHLISEQVTGVDIVDEQMRIASGDGLNLSQDEISFSGAAINCRINAEDPLHGFVPTPGCVTKFHSPGGPGVRVDSALFEGCQIPEFYDSLIAKISCYGRNREEARERARTALDETIIEGVKTTIPLHLMLLENKQFIRGAYHTQLLDRLLGEWKPTGIMTRAEAAGIYFALKRSMTSSRQIPLKQVNGTSRWRQLPQQNATRPSLYVEGV